MSITKSDILQAHKERFACKKFDASKSISKDDVNFILEIARLSPSSIGLEPWKFVVINDKNLRKKLKPLCWNQSQIVDASLLIAILARTKKSLFDKKYVMNRYAKKGRDPKFYIDYIKSLPDINEWTKKQCYIVLANIMSSAKMIGIDSCAIEGFDSSKKITEVIGYDTDEYDLAVLVALGSRDMEITPKDRLDLNEVVDIK